MKKRICLLALVAMACAFMSSCVKGERCECNGRDLGYVEDCYTACFGEK